MFTHTHAHTHTHTTSHTHTHTHTQVPEDSVSLLVCEAFLEEGEVLSEGRNTSGPGGNIH
jgi:hypothetical protein